MEPEPGASRSRSRPARRLVAWVLPLLLCLVAAEVGARAFFLLRHGVPWRDPGKILYSLYPELETVDRDQPGREDAYVDILLLGGSVLQREWGEVEQVLLEELSYRGHRNARVFNLARQGHTSRDSLLKYRALGDVRFDLVVFYHGINEVRANNVPPDLFRQDYSHYGWYEIANALAPRQNQARLALPAALRFLGLQIKQYALSGSYVPAHAPRPEWLEYGATPHSPAALASNLTAFLELAAERQDPVLLMTFALHVPEGYTRSAFKQECLGYGLHHIPLDLWGRPEHVVATVAAHNDEVRRLAGERPGVLFVDQASRLAGSPRDFNDACHLTVTGSTRFVEGMLEVILPMLPAGESACRSRAKCRAMRSVFGAKLKST